MFCVLFFAWRLPASARHDHAARDVSRCAASGAAEGRRSRRDQRHRGAATGTRFHDLVTGTEGADASPATRSASSCAAATRCSTRPSCCKPRATADRRRAIAGVVAAASICRIPESSRPRSRRRRRESVTIADESVKATRAACSRRPGMSNYFRILTGTTDRDATRQQRFISPVGFGQLAERRGRSRAGSTRSASLIAINIFVGLFNLLPLLPFDGGHIAIASLRKGGVDDSAPPRSGRRGQADAGHGCGRWRLVHPDRPSLFLDITHPVCNLTRSEQSVAWASCRRAATTRQVMVGDVPVGGDAPRLGAVDDDDEDRRRRRHARADLRAGRRGLRHRALHVQRGRSGRRARADRAAFAGADRRRHPLPAQARARRDGSGRAGVAAQPRQHPQGRPHQARRGRSEGPRHPDPHRCERGFARSRDGRTARRDHTRSARRVGDARARPVPRGRLRRREDLGEGVERSADDRLVPLAVGDDRSSVASRRHRSGTAAAGVDQRRRRDRHAARRRHRRHDSLLAHRRSGRGSEGRAHAARSARSARAQGSRSDRVPVVRARRGRRHQGRERRAGRTRSRATSRCRSR